MSVAWVGAGVAAVGTISQMDAAKGAASAQQAGSDNAIAAQMLASAQMQTALMPWTQAGGAAQTRLNQLLGLGGAGSGGRTSMGLATGLSPDQVRQQLLSRYTKQPAAGAPGTTAPTYRSGMDAVAALGAQGAHDYFQNRNTQGSGSDMSHLWTTPNMTNPGEDGQRIYEGGGQQYAPAGEVDEEGLQAAIDKYYAEQDALNAAAESDPLYGSLLRAYRDGQEFSFTGKDLASDPGYQFGLDQGTQGINRAQAARGNYLSGAAMKEINRFNQDYAGTKFNDAFTRNLNTWTTNLNAYDRNRNTLYDMLSGVSRTGQNSAAQVGTSNVNSAASIGNAMIGSGNAAAAGQVAGSNALVSGLNGITNAFSQNTGTNGAAGWNSLISSGATPYGASPTSVSGGSWSPTPSIFGASNGRLF